MTDRDVYEHFYRRYADPDTVGKIEAHEKQLAAVEEEFAQKPLDQRKAEFWDMCRDFGCKEADIQAQWDEYLKGNG